MTRQQAIEKIRKLRRELDHELLMHSLGHASDSDRVHAELIQLSRAWPDITLAEVS